LLALIAVASIATSCVPETPEDTGAPEAGAVNVTGGRPILQLATGSIAFGAVTCGTQAAARGVLIANAGDAPLDYEASLLGTGFTLAGASKGTIPPGSSASIALAGPAVQADAIPGVTVSAKLRIVTNDPSHGDIQLPITLTPTGARLQVSASSLGLAGPGSGSAQLTFTNQGNAPVDVALSLPAGSPFHVPAAVHVPPGGSAPARVDFASASDVAADLVIAAQGALCGAAPAVVHLSAHAVAAGVPYVTVTKLDFGPLDCGAPSSQSFDLVNGSDEPVAFTGHVETGAFTFSPPSGTVAAHDTAHVVVTANVKQTPGSAATDTLVFTAPPYATTDLTVALDATAHGAILQVQPASLTFASPSATSSQPFTITNTGDAPAAVSLDVTGDPAFTTSAQVITVSPSSPGSISVTFQPPASGTYHASIGFAAQASCGPVPGAISLDGTAIDAGDAGTDGAIDAAIDVGYDAPDVFVDAPFDTSFDAPIDVFIPDTATPDVAVFDAVVNDAFINDAIVGASISEPASRP